MSIPPVTQQENVRHSPKLGVDPTSLPGGNPGHPRNTPDSEVPGGGDNQI